ncbi:MAG: hypothetical protein CL554_20135 [Algoriphagus sp.]|nr:hypothetical protein [Algoriphagus sp.]
MLNFTNKILSGNIYQAKGDKMLKLSDEALGAVMMALQKSLMEQSDIVPVLKGFNFKVNEEDELYVMNPPMVKLKANDNG